MYLKSICVILERIGKVPEHVSPFQTQMLKRFQHQVAKLTADQYHRLSDQYLNHLSEILEEHGESLDDFTSDFHDGILSFNISNYNYVLNKQPPNKQIWWSSPISGPLRFDFNGQMWENKNNVILGELLEKEWKQLTKQLIDLSKYKQSL
eukprot:NODE_1137_length_2056_cov_0.948901.p2 type:complete len:150 gc:universal NODE_1137_length_2056_cov_0.948901:1854-1405(-)